MKKKGKKLSAYQKEYDRIKRQVSRSEKMIYINKEVKLLDNAHSTKLKKALDVMEKLGRTPERVTAEDIRTLQNVNTLAIKSSYGWERQHHKFKYTSAGDKDYLFDENGNPIIETTYTSIRKKEEKQRSYKAKLNAEKRKAQDIQGFKSDKEVKDYWNNKSIEETVNDDINALLGVEEVKEESKAGKILSYADVIINNYIDSTAGTLEQIKDSRSNVEWAQWTNDLMDYVREICLELIKTKRGKNWLAEQIQNMNVPVIIWGDSVEWTTKVAKMNYFLENAKEIDTDPHWGKRLIEITRKINEKLEEASYQREMGTERGDYD